MEEKNVIKIRLSTLLLILAIIVIAVMGLYILNLQQEVMKSYNAQIDQGAVTTNDNIENDDVSQVSDNEENEVVDEINDNIANNDFETLMKKLYPPREYREDSTTYNYMISEKDFVTMTNQDESVSIESTFLFLYEDEICLNIQYFPETKLDPVSTTIKGIDEEVVAVTMHTFEAEANPSLIVLLTRNGNVYYLKDFSNNFEAQKIEELSEIIKIDTIEKAHDDSYHVETATIAIDKDGNYIDLDKYIY